MPVLLLALLVAVAYFAFQRIVANTGAWAIAAAENGLVAAGLPEDQRAPFELQVARLKTALESEESDSSEVVNGVALLLDTAMVPLLVLDDVRDRRLRASGLNEAERVEAESILGRVGRLVDAKAMTQGGLIEILGELTEVPDDGSTVPLSDGGLRALIARAKEQIASMEEERAEEETQVKYRVNAELPAEAKVTPTRDVLLERFTAHVDAVLAGTAPKVDR